jgi:hypothetical protein
MNVHDVRSLEKNAEKNAKKCTQKIFFVHRRRVLEYAGAQHADWDAALESQSGLKGAFT